MIVTKVYVIDCSKFVAERKDGVSIESPFFIGEDSDETVIVSEDKKEVFTEFYSKLFQVCESEKVEIDIRDMLIGEQESAVKDDWFEL